MPWITLKSRPLFVGDEARMTPVQRATGSVYAALGILAEEVADGVATVRPVVARHDVRRSLEAGSFVRVAHDEGPGGATGRPAVLDLYYHPQHPELEFVHKSVPRRVGVAEQSLEVRPRTQGVRRPRGFAWHGGFVGAPTPAALPSPPRAADDSKGGERWPAVSGG